MSQHSRAIKTFQEEGVVREYIDVVPGRSGGHKAREGGVVGQGKGGRWGNCAHWHEVWKSSRCRSRGCSPRGIEAKAHKSGDETRKVGLVCTKKYKSRRWGAVGGAGEKDEYNKDG